MYLKQYPGKLLLSNTDQLKIRRVVLKSTESYHIKKCCLRDVPLKEYAGKLLFEFVVVGYKHFGVDLDKFAKQLEVVTTYEQNNYLFALSLHLGLSFYGKTTVDQIKSESAKENKVLQFQKATFSMDTTKSSS